MSDGVYRMRIAWEGASQGRAVLGSARLGTSRLGYNYSPYLGAPGSIDDVSTQVKGFTLRRGRDDNLRDMVQGVLDLTLIDKDGRFSPKATSGSYVGKVRPMRAGYLEASWDGGTTWDGLFYGWLDEGSSNYDYGAKEARFKFSDSLILLGGEDQPVIPATGATTTGAAIAEILSSLRIKDPAFISLAVGDDIPDFEATGDAGADSLVSELLRAERGVFYASKNGVLTYQTRHAKAFKTSQFTFTQTGLMVPGTALSNVKSKATVERTQNGYVGSYEDTSVSTEFGVRSVPKITTPYLLNDTQADQLAQYIVTQVSDPGSTIWGVEIIEGPTGHLEQLIRRELLDRVTINQAGILGDYHIEQITLSYDGEDLLRGSWKVSERIETGMPIVIGTYQIGGPQIVAY